MRAGGRSLLKEQAGRRSSLAEGNQKEFIQIGQAGGVY
jgi:hypothetical protein